MDPREYVYVRIDPKEGSSWQSRKNSDLATTRAHLKAARLDGFQVHRRYAVSERVGAAVAASGRPKLMRLIKQLEPGDALVVRTIDGLGRDASDILKTIRRVQSLGAEVFCVALNPDNLFSVRVFMETLEALASLERRTSAERKRAKTKGVGVAGGRIGRPPSLDLETQAAVRASLDAGETISALARRYNTSRQTILRAREARSPQSRAR